MQVTEDLHAGELVSVVRQLEDERNELQAALDDKQVQLEAQTEQINNLEVL